MTTIVPSDKIEEIVGALRDPFKHLGRAVSGEEQFYILHSAVCLAEQPDLRRCAFSVALDELDHSEIWEWPQDVPLQLRIETNGDLIWAEQVRACRECLCTDDHTCDPPCCWVEHDLCSSCSSTGEEG